MKLLEPKIASEVEHVNYPTKFEHGSDQVVAVSVQMEAAGGEEPDEPPAVFRVRYYVLAIAVMSSFITTFSRSAINFAIIEMVDTDIVETQPGEAGYLFANGTTAPYFDLDNSCPLSEEARRQRLLGETGSDTRGGVISSSSSGVKYKWDTFRQGLVKAAFSIGLTISVFGGWWSDVYGSVKVLSLGAIFIATCCLLAPHLAALHFYLIFFDLILVGFFAGVMTSALVTLLSNWCTPGEKSFLMSFFLVTSRLGNGLSLLLCGLIIEANYPWQYIFYFAGCMSLLYALIIMISGRSQPTEHPLIGSRELEYLASRNTRVKEALCKKACQKHSAPTTTKNKPSGPPWLAIVANVPVVTFVVTKLCVKLCGDLLVIELSSYLKRVMHFSAKENGSLSAANSIVFCAGGTGVGILTTWLSRARPFGVSKTTSRKILQSIGSFVPALGFIAIAYSICDDISNQIFILLVQFFLSFPLGGEAQMPLDLSERYSGTIEGIGRSMSSSGMLEPPLIGYLLLGHSADRAYWKFIWLGASAISAFGGIVFVLFGDAQIQPFDSIDPNEEQKRKQSKTSEKLSHQEV